MSSEIGPLAPLPESAYPAEAVPIPVEYEPPPRKRCDGCLRWAASETWGGEGSHCVWRCTHCGARSVGIRPQMAGLTDEEMLAIDKWCDQQQAEDEARLRRGIEEVGDKPVTGLYDGLQEWGADW